MDGNLQRKIVDALHLEGSDEVLEIGPGRGALTRHLAGRCRRLFLVELDRDLARDLTADFGGIPGIEVLNQDILSLSPADLTPLVQDLKVVGNIPYNITTPILFHLLLRPRPREILLMVQKEVGERILADPGTSAFGALSIGVRSIATAERVLKVPATAFRPVPAVESVVIRIRPVRPEPLTPNEEQALRNLTRIAFQQRRKQVQTILRKHPALALSPEGVRQLAEATGFDFKRRPGTFSPSEFILLSQALKNLTPPLRE